MGASAGVRQNARRLAHIWTSEYLAALRSYVTAECARVDPALGITCVIWVISNTFLSYRTIMVRKINEI
jgi:hypothetical protein